MNINQNYLKIISSFLTIILFFNFFLFFIAGNNKVEAGIWDNNKDNIYMAIKGLLMFWIIRVITNNDSEESDIENTSSEIKKTVEEEIKITEEKSSEKREILNLINEFRVENNLAKLELNNKLSEIAKMKAEDMVANNYFDHNSPTYGSPFEMLKNENISYGLAGENLAEANSIRIAHQKLLDSKSHRENILEERFDKVGIAVVEGNNYELLIVQLFIDSNSLNK
ncbi:MAG: CAP domain-containing protein [Bacillota bacterium]